MTPRIKELMDRFGMERWMFQNFWEIFCQVDLDDDVSIDSMELCLWMQRCQCVSSDDISSITSQFYEGFKCIGNAVMWERNVMMPKLRMKYARSLTFEEFCGMLMVICVASKKHLVDLQYLCACRGAVEVNVAQLQSCYKPYYATLNSKEKKKAMESFGATFGVFDRTRIIKKFEIAEAAAKEETEWVIYPITTLQKIIRDLTFGGASKWVEIGKLVNACIDEDDLKKDTPLKVLAEIISPKKRTRIVLGREDEVEAKADAEKAARKEARRKEEERKKKKRAKKENAKKKNYMAKESGGKQGKEEEEDSDSEDEEERRERRRQKKSQVSAWQPKRFKKRKPRPAFNAPIPDD
eukprot:CAMPEP_0167816000 /NCGR_PEP_ID=MMETSP0112_2-20121227/3343_1 /TAXON_ID=91324 /ORGANISM="Lotharella globosa, Strain CCCM811" /LENGTH=351 /DNA_ID=CAMNT_0007715499 /DNA_START=187 /DNA_END=1242 /DNA_ORIENTATION=-